MCFRFHLILWFSLVPGLLCSQADVQVKELVQEGYLLDWRLTSSPNSPLIKKELEFVNEQGLRIFMKVGLFTSTNSAPKEFAMFCQHPIRLTKGTVSSGPSEMIGDESEFEASGIYRFRVGRWGVCMGGIETTDKPAAISIANLESLADMVSHQLARIDKSGITKRPASVSIQGTSIPRWTAYSIGKRTYVKGTHPFERLGWKAQWSATTQKLILSRKGVSHVIQPSRSDRISTFEMIVDENQPVMTLQEFKRLNNELKKSP